jgi:hypothetical protein
MKQIIEELLSEFKQKQYGPARQVREDFEAMASNIVLTTEPSYWTVEALRKLLEARDACQRAVLLAPYQRKEKQED